MFKKVICLLAVLFVIPAVAAGNPSVTTNYRSIGINDETLAGEDSSTASVAQGTTTVTFSGISLPANIGKGDQLTLDPSGINEVRYILSRDSATQVTLQSAAQGDFAAGVSYRIQRAYNTFAAWEAARRGDLVAENRLEVGVCYNDGPFLGGGAYLMVEIDDSITDAEHFMWLTVADGHRHNGVAGTGVVVDGENTTKIAFAVEDDYTRIEGFEIKRFRSRNGATAVEVDEATNVLCDGLLIHDFYDPGASVVGIKGSDESGFTARNCIIYNGDTAAIRLKESDAVATVENCTVYGMSGRGLYEDDGVLTVINTISMGNDDEDFDIAAGQQSYNMSSDSTAQGTGCLANMAAGDQFVSIATGSEDLHLKDAADAIDAGDDMAPSFTADIDGDSRPNGTAWDIGADEYLSQQNAPPVADAGGNQTVTRTDTVQLDGSGSNDPDSDPLTHQWLFVSVPAGSTATLSDPAIVNPTFVADLAGTYEVQLIVNDGSQDSAPDTVIITANPQMVPVPNVADLLQADAQTTITGAGLTVGTITNAHSVVVPIGHVISQDPAAGTSVDEGTAVALVVSLGPVMVTVPDVVGQTQANAEAALTGANLTVGAITTENSATVPAGNVISQNPTFGTSVAQGTAVDIVVSLGPVTETVPNVVGQVQANAEATITGANLTVGTITTENSATVPAGSVISQNPAAGASAAEGSAVDLVVSSGPATVSVPNVVGQTQTSAETAITGANLTVGVITTENSATVPAGSVISQNPAADTSVAQNSAVDLVVSLGPVTVTVPNVVGQIQANAEAAITGANLTVGTITTENSDTMPVDQVISQNPVAGSNVVPGSSVNLVISLGPSVLPPTAGISADPMTINSGQTSTITWTTTNADTVTIEPAIGSVGPSGSIPVILEATTTFTITANGAGGTATENVTVVVNSPITLQITSPSNNVTVNKRYIMVEGYIANPTSAEVGITVNEVPAILNGDWFVANNVPLVEGDNTVTAVVTDLSGASSNISITVYRDVAGDYLTITAITQTGVSPLETVLSVEGSFEIQSLSMYYAGPAALDSFENLGDNEFRATMSSIGVFYFTAEATDAANNAYSDTVAVQVMDQAALDTLLKAKWDGMKGALANQDIESATQYFTAETQELYNDIFNRLYARLPQISQAMQEIQLVYVGEKMAKYRIHKDEMYGGQMQTFTFYVYFVIDDDGIWKIYRY